MCANYRNTCTKQGTKARTGVGSGRAVNCPSNALNQAKPKPSLKLLDNILDISSTIARILTICGLDDTRATQAVSRITHAFLHFDEKLQDRPGNVSCKTRHLRRDDLLDSLKKECSMSDEEAKLAASVAKCAFRAFYHKQSLRKYDAGYCSEDDWQTAAQRTIAAYAKAGASKSELELAAKRIDEAYKGYMNRIAVKQSPLENNQCDRINQQNCYHCSAKTNYPNNNNQSNAIEGMPNEQVICSCCGCLKKSPVSYRDSKGRSILLKENNELFYNTQRMKQEVDAVRSFGPCGQQGDADLDDPLPRALMKLTRDMIMKVIRSGQHDSFGTEKFDTHTLDNGTPQRGSHRARSHNRDTVDSSPSRCDCGGEGRRRKNGSTKDMSYQRTKKDFSTPPNSIAGDYYSTSLNEGDAKVQIVLRGICRRSETGRPKVDILGLKLVNNEFDDALEFVCKQRVHSTNRYTQTGGSTVASECGSDLSSVDKPFARPSNRSGTRSSKRSINRQSLASTIQHANANSLGSMAVQDRHDQNYSKLSKPEVETLSHKFSVPSEAKNVVVDRGTHKFETEANVEPIVEVLHEFGSTILRESESPSRAERDEAPEEHQQPDNTAEEPVKEDISEENPPQENPLQENPAQESPLQEK